MSPQIGPAMSTITIVSCSGEFCSAPASPTRCSRYSPAGCKCCCASSLCWTYKVVGSSPVVCGCCAASMLGWAPHVVPTEVTAATCIGGTSATGNELTPARSCQNGAHFPYPSGSRRFPARGNRSPSQFTSARPPSWIRRSIADIRLFGMRKCSATSGAASRSLGYVTMAACLQSKRIALIRCSEAAIPARRLRGQKARY